MLWLVAVFGLQSGGRFVEFLLMCVPGSVLVRTLLCVLVSGSGWKQCCAKGEPQDVLVQEGTNPIWVAVHRFRRIMNCIFLRVRVLVEAWENKVLNCKLSTGEEGGRINHYWMLKNMLCNLAEDMLSNCAEARIAVHSIKAKIAEMDAQLTAMDNSFSWKGTTSISSLNVHNLEGGA